jgi:PBP1b-binding outer membrane lipoprotein LpoB
MSLARVAVLLSAVLIVGCASERQVIADATKEARDHCLAEGKQFIQTKTEIGSPQDSPFSKSIKVEGVCVGPGDPGYVEPPVAMPKN